MDIYTKAMEEMKENFNNKDLIIINRNINKVIFNGKVRLAQFSFEDDIIRHIFVFSLSDGHFIAFDFDDALYVKLNINDEYGLVYEKYLFLVNNLKKENIKNYVELQNLDFTDKDIENILYEK